MWRLQVKAAYSVIIITLRRSWPGILVWFVWYEQLVGVSSRSLDFAFQSYYHTHQVVQLDKIVKRWLTLSLSCAFLCYYYIVCYKSTKTCTLSSLFHVTTLFATKALKHVWCICSEGVSSLHSINTSHCCPETETYLHRSMKFTFSYASKKV